MSVRTPDPEPDENDPFSPPSGGLGVNPGWLSEFELAESRRRLPILYVEGIPVRVDGMGQVIEVGILLRATPLGEMSRTIVSGRVRYGETVRDALFRHLENDLGPMAFPQIPVSPVPVQIAEYFPTPNANAYLDERQHAVSLVYVVPVTGSCSPRQDALEVSWLPPEEALMPSVLQEMLGGRGKLLRQALSTVGC